MKVVLTKNFRKFLEDTDGLRDLSVNFLHQMLSTVDRGFGFTDGSPEAVKEFDRMCKAAYDDLRKHDDVPEGMTINSIKETFASSVLLENMPCGDQYGKSQFGGLLAALTMVCDADEYNNDPFIKNIHIPHVSSGNATLTHDKFHAHELFEYEGMAPCSWGTFVPRLGFFEEEVQVPSIDIGPNSAWPNATPSTINTMALHVGSDNLSGRVLALGCGIGYFPYMASLKENVESIVVVEADPHIAALFTEHILPQFQNKEKIHVTVFDPVQYLQEMEDGSFDYCLAAPWTSSLETDLYLQIKSLGNKLRKTKIEYWMESSLQSSLLSGLAVDMEHARQKAIALEKHETIPGFPWASGAAGHVQRFIHELTKKEVVDGRKKYEDILSIEYVDKMLSSKKLNYVAYDPANGQEEDTV